ncbi:four helix bundle protein [candidate division KSB1 bacterium]|nr:four helix bundle protein [candidate division KSB1 bacterium]NIS27632.1 four helix bundle protein [candidate division KSB1 bacterium]NIU28997.1 four helix bundle protein [candidate division KSB1 bacterium]NIU91379.1 four helix bundle protein [candidate division KSB1 bacterium]NIV93717.1 four helix bundle protein [candidate division KSB1 bacterium]
MNDFRNLTVWRKSRLLILELFNMTNDFNGLSKEIRSACVAITTHIALAFSHKNDTEKAKHLQIAIELAHKLEKCLQLGWNCDRFTSHSYVQVTQDVKEIKALLESEI